MVRVTCLSLRKYCKCKNSTITLCRFLIETKDQKSGSDWRLDFCLLVLGGYRECHGSLRVQGMALMLNSSGTLGTGDASPIPDTH